MEEFTAARAAAITTGTAGLNYGYTILKNPKAVSATATLAGCAAMVSGCLVLIGAALLYQMQRNYQNSGSGDAT